MNLLLHPARLAGTIPAISSKSQAHRLLLCAALAGAPTRLDCPDTSQDIESTARCLGAMGAQLRQDTAGFSVAPIRPQRPCVLPCGESGSTLRFLLPVTAALGLDAEFHMEGRLSQRPLTPLDQELESHGVRLSRPRADILLCSGQLRPGDYRLPGNVSSQYISGLLFALPLLPEGSTLTVTGPVESGPYIRMTLDALSQFGVSVLEQNQTWRISPASYQSPGRIRVEGDWSNAAFWLAANALGSHVTVTGLCRNSLQGDREIVNQLPRLGGGQAIDASGIPDLVPILAVTASKAKGSTRFVRAQRLRLKESDRIATVCSLLQALGGSARPTPDGLVVEGGPLSGGTVQAAGDHRIAMAAAIAATVCTGPVTLLGAQAVNKSYPRFWQDYQSLGGVFQEVSL